MSNSTAKRAPYPGNRRADRGMTPKLHPSNAVPPPSPSAHGSVRAWLHRLAPECLADLDRALTPVPHARPPEAVGYGLDLQRLDHGTKGLDLVGLPAWIQHATRSRQLTYLGGRLCAETALLAATGQCEAIATGEGGAPCWPAGATGSIAHTQGHAWAVVGRLDQGHHLGIDSECIVDENGAQDIVALCCTPWERTRWFPSMHPIGATLLFSAKESVYKAIHPIVKRFVDFDEVEMIDCTSATGQGLAWPADGAKTVDGAHTDVHLLLQARGPLADQIRTVQVHARVMGTLVHTAVVRKDP